MEGGRHGWRAQLWRAALLVYRDPVARLSRAAQAQSCGGSWRSSQLRIDHQIDRRGQKSARWQDADVVTGHTHRRIAGFPARVDENVAWLDLHSFRMIGGCNPGVSCA